MFLHFLVAKLIHLRYETVQEITIVGYDNQCAIEIHQGLLQNIFRLHVEVVGRFVQYQEVNGFEQKLDHRQTGTFTTAQHLYLLHGSLGATEHKRTEQIAYLVTDIPLCHIVDGLEYGQVFIQQRCLILCKIANLYIMTKRQGALMLYFVHDTLHQRGLTFTILTHEGNLVATFDGEINILENYMRPT